MKIVILRNRSRGDAETSLLRGIKSFENGTVFPLVSEGEDGAFLLASGFYNSY